MLTIYLPIAFSTLYGYSLTMPNFSTSVLSENLLP